MAPKKSALRFASQERVVLPGSEKAPLSSAADEKPARSSSVITVSVIVKRKTPLNLKRLGKDRLTRTEYRQ
jgi:kumamolisin